MGYGQIHTWTFVAVSRKALDPSSGVGNVSGAWEKQEVADARTEGRDPEGLSLRRREKVARYSLVSPSSRSRPT